MRKRRWFQFSLRTLLVFVLLVSIGMSWLGVKFQRARKQREAVEVIEKLGGFVTYDFQLRPVPLAPKWMREVFGNDFFYDVVLVSAAGPDCGDDETAYLKRLTNVEFLDLRDTQVTDIGLVHLEGLTDLEVLFLTGTQVTTQGLESLRQALPNCDIHPKSQP